MNYQKAIDLLDLMKQKDIRLRELMRVFNPVQKKAATNLLSGKATDKDLDVVEQELSRYTSILGNEGSTVAQSRKASKPRKEVLASHEKSTRLYRHYLERAEAKPDRDKATQLIFFFKNDQLEKFLKQQSISHQSIQLHEQILEKYKQL